MQLNFNKEAALNQISLSIGSTSGYRLYNLVGIEKFKLSYKSCETRDCTLVQRLFCSSLVAIVSEEAPRTVQLFNFVKNKKIGEIKHSHNVLGMQFNRRCMVVCLEEKLFIYNIDNLQLLHKIRDAPPNPTGLCALSICTENNYLAYPASTSRGDVSIFDINNMVSKTLKAHNELLAALVFSSNGTRIATASQKGTLIRVFSVMDATKLYEFTRGVMRCVTISCLAFSGCGNFLCSSSNTNTVHVFKLEEPSTNGDVGSGWMSYVASYLPATGFNRAFATAHSPVSGVKNVVTLATINQELRLLVVTEESILYIYNVNSEGGELPLFKKIPLDESVDLECSESIPTDSDADNENDDMLSLSLSRGSGYDLD